ncbi:type I-E CRISPR-associated protein Cas6/Cse3/CasE [Actinokineospora auranticolor]|uniref:CRISPR system Cascade subunit CasE n=1 Tax=Actinokineospora auranticolor TaxID=155976 RepID=A0A2S6GEV4_9PSEU|nr:type I-E CRISPR-associated protein Cas6/Cse3/CasE [Actinokineospora auranticolor]PPK63768.1 CRISPR system Cascade subunit CasE [Actinokineospora auranticolor]
MFLTKLTIDPRSTAFRRDAADVHNMHRTVMSAYPELPETETYRQSHGVLWRLEAGRTGVVQYVQSRTRPEWTGLPDGHLLAPAQVRPLDPVLESIAPGRRFAFRLLANPTRCVRPVADRGARKRVPHREPVAWLAAQGARHGFVIPVTGNGDPDVVAVAVPLLVGRKSARRITVQPVRFDGHLVVTDATAFAEAVVAGVGRAKSYGCGLLSLAPPRARE